MPARGPSVCAGVGARMCEFQRWKGETLVVPEFLSGGMESEGTQRL